MILDENPNCPPKFVKNCIFKFLLIIKKKKKVQFFLFFFFYILLDLFYDCANFWVNRSITATRHKPVYRGDNEN